MAATALWWRGKNGGDGIGDCRDASIRNVSARCIRGRFNGRIGLRLHSAIGAWAGR